MTTTYTEAQYSTPSARKMIREQFLDIAKYPNPDKQHIDAVARYMSRSLRIGGMRICRMIVMAAIAEGTSAE